MTATRTSISCRPQAIDRESRSSIRQARWPPRSHRLIRTDRMPSSLARTLLLVLFIVSTMICYSFITLTFILFYITLYYIISYYMILYSCPGAPRLDHVHGARPQEDCHGARHRRRLNLGGSEKGEVLLEGVGTLRYSFPPDASVQWQPGQLTINTKKWFLGAGFLGAPPISLGDPGGAPFVRGGGGVGSSELSPPCDCAGFSLRFLEALTRGMLLKLCLVQSTIYFSL